MKKLMDKEADCTLSVVNIDLRRDHEHWTTSTKRRGVGPTKATRAPWSVKNLKGHNLIIWFANYLSHLAQVTHFLILDVLVYVTGPAGGGTGLPHDQDPLLAGLRVDPLKPDAGF